MHAKVKNRLAHACAKPIEGTSFQYPAPPEIDESPQGIITGLIEVRKREFRPNQPALEALRGQGFKDRDIVEALRATRNVKALAASWLAGKDRVVPDDSAAGLEPNSRLLTALVANPTIRLGLSNPKTLLAFLGIVETPTSANLWLTDPDTSPVLSSIFKLYHAERHMSPEN
jgi:Kip1 ubiquitination-promoting complex protein 2